MLEHLVDRHHPIHDLLQKRWSPRAFADRPVESEKLVSMLEAARWAASSYNQQPWSFIVATKDRPAEYARLFSCLIEFNQAWARSAPVLMMSVAKLHFDLNGKENHHAFHDVGAAAANLSTQATALNLFVHQMAGFDGARARSIYQIPQEWEPVAILAIGYLGDPQTLAEPMRSQELAPRIRKPLAEFVFAGEWERSAELVTDD
jgi:nitroreductase